MSRTRKVVIDPTDQQAVFGVFPCAGLNGPAKWFQGQDRTVVSRQGNKIRLMPGLARAWALPRKPLAGYWANEADPVLAAYLVMLESPDLQAEVARRIRAWIPCPTCLPGLVAWAAMGVLHPTPKDLSGHPDIDPACAECGGTGTQDARRLWDRLRSQRWPEQVADWIRDGLTGQIAASHGYIQARSFRSKPVETRDGQIHSHGYLPEHLPLSPSWLAARPWTQEEIDRGQSRVPRELLAAQYELVPHGGSALVTNLDAGQVLPDLLASWLVRQSRSLNGKPIGLIGGSGYKPEIDCVLRAARKMYPTEDRPRWTLADMVGELGVSDGLVTALDAADVLPDPDRLPVHDSKGHPLTYWLSLDPPYLGDQTGKVTGYAHGFPRDRMFAMVERWWAACRDAGVRCLVHVHESVGLADDLRQITGLAWDGPIDSLSSRKSTFWSKQAGQVEANGNGIQREWLTSSEPPVEQIPGW